MIKKVVITLCLILFFSNISNANTIENGLIQANKIQTNINNIGANLLNSNKIDKRIVFTYNEDTKNKILKEYDLLSKRQVIVFGEAYKSAENDDEIAVILAREISGAVKSYDGVWGGRIDAIQVALGSKKFEVVADKRAVDYMVNAGYDPLAVITYITKTCPQKRNTLFSRANSVSKRLAIIYEYITYKYPEYLNSSKYLDNKYYQNFLLTSIDNRKLLEEKIKNNSNKELKYE